MDKGFAKLMEKKGASSKPLDEGYKGAKMSMLHALKDEMSGMMGSDLKGLKGMKKVTVASPDAEGLEEGLEKAQDLVGQAEGGEEHGAGSEGYEQAMSYFEGCSPEQLDEAISHLQELKAAKAK